MFDSVGGTTPVYAFNSPGQFLSSHNVGVVELTVSILASKVADPEPEIHSVQLPELYIKIMAHPHSAETPQIISLSSPTSSLRQYIPELSATKPWYRFSTRQDFEYTATAIRGTLGRDLVNEQLRGIRGDWSGGNTNITLKNYDDMISTLDKAGSDFTPVCCSFFVLE